MQGRDRALLHLVSRHAPSSTEPQALGQLSSQPSVRPRGLGGETWQVGCFRGSPQTKLSDLHLLGHFRGSGDPASVWGKLLPTVQETVNVPLGSACYKTSERMEAQEMSAFGIRLCRGAGGRALSHARLS